MLNGTSHEKMPAETVPLKGLPAQSISQSAPSDRPALMILASNAGAAPNARQAFVRRVVEVIEQHLDDENLQVDTLARHLAMGRTPFYRRLQALTGQTPAKLILDMRLEKAARLVATDPRPLRDIANQVGFKTASHFGQRFRERFGVPPSTFRRRHLATVGESATV